MFSSTPIVPTTPDTADYCAHGVTIGATCRHCTRSHVDNPPAPPGAPRARRMGFIPGTSLIAHQIGAEHVSAVQAAILDLLTDRPMTDDELHAAYLAAGHPRKTRQRIGTARAELAKLGKVRETGERRPSLLGNPARVWEVTPT